MYCYVLAFGMHLILDASNLKKNISKNSATRHKRRSIALLTRNDVQYVFCADAQFEQIHPIRSACDAFKARPNGIHEMSNKFSQCHTCVFNQ